MTKLHEREPKPGDRFRLENGKIVRFACLIEKSLGASKRLIVVAEDGEAMDYCYPSGNYFTRRTDDLDIDCYVEEPKTVKAWVNVYSFGFSNSHPSKEVADKMCSNSRLACKEIEITCTPGEGLS